MDKSEDKKLISVDLMRPTVSVSWRSEHSGIRDQIAAIAESCGGDNVGGGTFLDPNGNIRDEQFEFDTTAEARRFAARLIVELGAEDTSGIEHNV